MVGDFTISTTAPEAGCKCWEVGSAPARRPLPEDARAREKELIFLHEDFNADFGIVQIAGGRVTERHFEPD
jgi:hypothetical protein